MSGSGAAGDAGAPNSRGFCTQDADCDDGLYCNGKELCKQLSPGSDAKVCMGPEHGPCNPSDCTETTKCDCSHPDQDGDGYKVEGCTSDKNFDCDDNDRNRHPGNPEVCDDIDQDCSDQTFGTKDTDSDGYFDQACTNRLRYQPLFITLPQPLKVGGTDCDDNNPFVHPGAVEVCDNLDDNCNGEIDEVSGGQGAPHTYYQDLDGDYWGNDAKPLATLCNFPPPGYSVLHGDCNDQDPRVSPDREEICNGIDDDCDGKIDQPDKPGDLMFGQPYDGITDFECKGTAGWDVKQCPAGRLDCDASYLDACETVATTLCNCHACGKTCAFSCGDSDCEEIAALSTGDTHTCAIVAPTTAGSATAVAGGKVACWGRNALGQLGDGTTKDSPTPVLVGGVAGATAIALGERQSCALTLDSGVLCWGNNELGQLGARSPLPESMYPLQVRSLAEWGRPNNLASGKNHACAIYGGGVLACWGSDENGQLGNGSEGEGLSSDAPVQVLREVDGVRSFILDATRVVAGEGHTCVLAAGKVECWGDNSLGQLGEDPDTVTTRTVARAVPGLDGIVVDELVASAGHTCVRAGTAVYCWGSNLFGELAKDDVMFGTPTRIPLPSDIVSITAGRFFGCARSSDGTARCWGSNDSGQLAMSEDIPSAPPTLIPLQNIAGIFGGDGRHVCALTKDATAWCWGRNDFGQLGNNDFPDDRPMPQPVSTLNPSQRCSL
ncbi:MAG: MopE-related protein [Polyangiaceae bacterium]